MLIRVVLALLFFIPPFAFSSEYGFYFCAKATSDALSDFYSGNGKHHGEGGGYILMGLHDDSIEHVPGDIKATADGVAFILGDELLEFKLSSIMTMKNERVTDTISYISKANHVIGGFFYDGGDGEAKDVAESVPVVSYVSKDYVVHHLYTNGSEEKECVNKFPKKVIEKFDF